jgi:peptidoglycan/xylan/chitin deacetylase (PgdA/CDA1 family)
MPSQERAVYLTFDDGPIPEVTPWVLDTLAAYDAHATFFCVGRNAAANPDILARIVAEGHAVGNHTWGHVNGWRTPLRSYMKEVVRAEQALGQRGRRSLFRPPYGRITRQQAQALSPRYAIVMWDVLSADFDTTLTGPQCLSHVVDHVRPGSIVVFHDSVKAWPRLHHALPATLALLTAAGYTFHTLERLRA